MYMYKLSFETLNNKKIRQGLVLTKIKTQINKMLAHCFNPQLARGHAQSSNWPTRLSIRIKPILNIAIIQFPTSEFQKSCFVRITNDIVFQTSFTF